jgi:hypothetical protein
MTSIRSQTAADIFLYLSPFIGLLLAMLFGGLLFGVSDSWDRATVVRVCHDGTKVFRMEDGEYRVRAPSSFRSFHAASADVCG